MNFKKNIKIRTLYRLSIWILLAFLYYFLVVSISNWDPNYLSIDFPQYWAAGRLLILHENPYDPGMVVHLRQEVGQYVEITESTTLMLYPPWTLPLFIPIGMLPYKISLLIWWLFNITILLYCTRKIWIIYQGSQNHRWISYLFFLSLFPNFYVLLTGHVSPILLLSVVIFLSQISDSHGSVLTDLSAGISLAILTIKPQLVLPVFLLLFFWIIYRKRWLVLMGIVGTLLISTFIVFLINPRIFDQYLHTLNKYPMGYWATPTMGMLLRFFFGIELFWLQFLPTIFGIVWASYYWYLHKDEWIWVRNLPIVTFVSILTTPYGWTYDFNILLLPLLYGAILLSKSNLIKIRNLFIFYFLALNLLVFIIHMKLSDFWFFWYVPILFIWYISAIQIIKQNKLTTLGMESISNVDIQ